MGTVAKVLTAIGAVILLAAGGCFLFVTEALGGADTVSLPWVIGVTLIVGGTLALIAFFGMWRERGD